MRRVNFILRVANVVTKKHQSLINQSVLERMLVELGRITLTIKLNNKIMWR